MKIDNSEFKSLIIDVADKLEKAEKGLGSNTTGDIVHYLRKDVLNIDDIVSTDRNMRIGIVGEVKAGKSSFLNALIFKGKDMLPKAPTPMTAALTKIGYSEEEYALVHFYTREDWQSIENHNSEYMRVVEEEFKRLEKKYYDEQKRLEEKHVDIPENLKKAPPTREKAERLAKTRQKPADIACHELIKLVEDKGILIDEYLGCKPCKLTGDIINQLQEYVGSNGRLTPLVKYTELYFTDELIKGIEIVDTPGLNDPVTSRSFLTKEFLSNCDVVFLLSYVGQFFGESDINFLTKEIADCNIKKAVLVGTKLDSGILDFNSPNKIDIKQAYIRSVQNYNTQAKNVLKNALSKYQLLPVLQCLNEENRVYYVSAYMYTAQLCLNEKKPYPAEVKHVVEEMKNKFSGMRDDVAIFNNLAGINIIKDGVLKKVIESKNSILQDRINDFVKSRIITYLNQLEETKIALNNNISLLENSDEKELQGKIDSISNCMKSSRIRVKGVFENQGIQAFKYIERIAGQIGRVYQNYTNIDVTSETNSENHEEGGIFGFFTHTVYETTTNYKADINCVMRNIDNVANEATLIINREFDNLFEISKIRNEIKEAVLTIFANSDEGFDENDVIIPVKTAINQLTINPVKVDAKKYIEILKKEFPDTEIKNEEITRLKIKQTDLLLQMTNDIKAELDKSAQKVRDDMNMYGGTFIDTIESSCRNNLENIKNQLKDKQTNIKRNKELVALIDDIKKELIAMREKLC